MSDKDALTLLLADRARAREAHDPCANLCVAATVDSQGQPQVRTMVLRELDTRLAIFLNDTSPKWQEISSRSQIAISIFLPSANLQYRMMCTFERVPESIVSESWLLRPDAPKRMDWFYTLTAPQSTAVESREVLLAGCAELDLPDPLIAPSTARGLFVDPEVIERLDLAQSNGIHDRRRYENLKGVWVETILVP